LRVLLAREGIALARTTIHRILVRHDLVREQDRHHHALARFERSAPNELWQMDFKGPKLWHQPVGPLSVLDDHSRYLLVLQAVGSTHAGVVREQLEGAFTHGGVPEGRLMDHGIPWWSAQAPGGATHLSLWLMRQGIRLHWSRIRHPQTQGKVERFHGTHDAGWECPTCRCGWTSIVGSITTSDRTKLWACRPRPAGGNPARGVTIPSRHAGSIPREPRC
jgi:transposase InsO family protein